VQQAEQMELAGGEVALDVRFTQTTHRDVSQQCEQQPGARAPLIEHAPGARLRGNWIHASSIGLWTIEAAI
jgi:hypothetical protein